MYKIGRMYDIDEPPKECFAAVLWADAVMYSTICVLSVVCCFVSAKYSNQAMLEKRKPIISIPFKKDV